MLETQTYECRHSQVESDKTLGARIAQIFKISHQFMTAFELQILKVIAHAFLANL